MRRSTFATLAILAVAATGCFAPPAARSTPFGGFGDVPRASAPAEPTAEVPLRRDSRHAAAIVRFVRDHRAQLEYCRDVERIHNPSFSGKATIEVSLEDNGYVLRARVLDRSWSADGAAMEDCMLTAIRRWDFPDSGPLDEFVHGFTVSFAAGDAEIGALENR